MVSKMKYDTKNNGELRMCSKCLLIKYKSEFGMQTVRMKNGQIWKGLRPDCKECHNKSIRDSRRLKRNQKLQR